MSRVKYSYALIDDTKLTHISTITLEDRTCNFACPSCRKPLRARLGDVRAHHFYHVHDSDDSLCSLETYVHYVGKHLLFDHLSGCLEKGVPYYAMLFKIDRMIDNSGRIRHQELSKDLGQFDILYQSNGVHLEKAQGDFRPDIMVTYQKETPLFVEIRVSHKSTREKVSENRLIEIHIRDEEDIERILSGMSEQTDSFFNLDSDRLQGTTRKWDFTKIELTAQEMANTLKRIESEFLHGKLWASVEYELPSLLGYSRRGATYTRVLLHDFYDEISINWSTMNCDLSNSGGSKLTIGFSIPDEQTDPRAKYLVVKKVSQNEPLLGHESTESNLKVNFRLMKDSYIALVNCFRPKGSHKSTRIELTLKELRALLRDEKIELISIDTIRRRR